MNQSGGGFGVSDYRRGFFQCTDCEIMGIVGGCEMSSDGECIFDLAREFERLLDKLYILYTFRLFEFQFGSSL